MISTLLSGSILCFAHFAIKFEQYLSLVHIAVFIEHQNMYGFPDISWVPVTGDNCFKPFAGPLAWLQWNDIYAWALLTGINRGVYSSET